MPRQKQDRQEILWEVTRSLCPECKKVIDAQVLLRNNQVVMRKYCAEHGRFEALLFNDAALYQQIARYNKPGTLPFEFATQPKEGCPHDCGICSEHQQHTCLALIEVTNACNLDCPLCFADAGTHLNQGGYWLTREQVDFMLDRLIAYEGVPEVVQFSGGEPTLHPLLPEFIEMARAKGIGQTMVNTNGLRLATDDRLLEQLAKSRPHIYLQFDGFEENTYRTIRGRADLLESKLRALERCQQAGLRVVLVGTIERGVNDHEVGRIVEFGLRHPAVYGVSFQCAFRAGRYPQADPLQRVTIPDVVRGIDTQTNGLFQLQDFVPVPCCMPDCAFVSYAILDGDAVTPIPRVLEMDPYLDYLKNRTAPAIDDELAGILSHLFSASALPGTDRVAAGVQRLVDGHLPEPQTRTEQRCLACQTQIPLSGHSPQDMSRHVFMVSIRDFADAYTFSLKNVMKCCIGFLIPDGRVIPFCAYNTVGYREQVTHELMQAQSIRP
jgi:uncharacterized radical SAM superfamily Fe-S cluster-containing enzyme